MEQEIWQYLKTVYPGQVQVLGPDVMSSGFNGSTLQQFRISAGNLTFPLLRDCADGSALADSNLLKPYTQRDNYVVINKQGVIRYHADDAWDYGNRYHADEILGTVDSLVDHSLDVVGPDGRSWGLDVEPNPSRGVVTFGLRNPSDQSVPARLQVVDLSGRRVATLPGRYALRGRTPVRWDGRDDRGQRLAPGLYLVRAEFGGRRFVRRIVLTR